MRNARALLNRFSGVLLFCAAFSAPLHGEQEWACYPWTKRAWMTGGAAVIGIGGGAWAGYVAGRNRQRFSGDASFVNPLCSFERSDEKVTFEWILPDYDDPMGSVTVVAEIFSPDQALVVRAVLTPSAASPPDIPSLGGKKNSLVGEYSIVFTLQEDVSSNPNGLFLGGISFTLGDMSYFLLTDRVFSSQVGGIVPAGTQASLTLPYPGGLYGTSSEEGA